MVKTFIQTVETQIWLRRGRQFLASTLIFSMLAMDVAKAMEDEKDSTRISHTIPPVLKYTGDDKTDSHSFNNYSADSEDDSDKPFLGSTDYSPEKQKPEDQNTDAVSLIASQTPQTFYPISSSPFTLSTNVELGSVDSRSLENREQPLFSVSVNYPQLSSSLIHHPLEVNSASDEVRDHHHQSNKAVSIKQHGNIIKLTLQRDTGVEDDTSLEFVDLGYSNIPPSSQSKQQDSRAKTKKLEQKPLPSSDSFIRSTGRLPTSSSLEDEQERQRLLRDLIGEEPSKSLFFDSRDTRKSNIPPIFTHNLSPKNSSQIVVVNERSSLLRSQPSIQCDDHDSDRSEDGEVSIEIGHSGNPDDPLYLVPSENRSQYKSCCGCSSKRPFCHKRTEYTLPNVGQHLDEFSRLVALLRQGHTLHNEEEESSNSPNSSFEIDNSGGSSSPYNGSPPEGIQVGDILEDNTGEDNILSDDLIIVKNSPSFSIIPDNRLNFLPSGATSSQPQLISIDQDLEQAGILASQAASFWESFEALPFNAKAKLKQFMHQVFNGKSTWKQRLGKWIFGPIIGAGFAYAMGPVYIGGIGYLGTQGEIFNEFIMSVGSAILVGYIMASALPDGIARNSHLWKKGITYLSQEKKELGRIFLAGLISFLTAFIPPTYLITAENVGRQELGLSGWNNEFGIAIAILGPPLFLDAFFSDFNTAWNALPQAKEFFGKLLCRKSLQSRIQPPEEIIREKFDEDLNKLTHFLFRASTTVIDEIYNEIKQMKDGFSPESSDKFDEDLTARQAFVVLSFLLSLGNRVVKGTIQPQSLYDTSVELLKYACLISGSPARAIALQFIGATVFGLVCPDVVAQALGGVFALFAFLPQTYLEDQGMDNFFKRFLFEEEPHAHGSHSVFRGLTKLFVTVQGLLYVFPLAVLTLQAFQTWFGEGWWPLVAGLPFFIPEFAAQAYSFNGTYNQKVATAIANIHNTKTRRCFGKEPHSDWKRDWLIQFTEGSRENLRQWHPAMIQKLKESTTVFQELVSNEL